MKKYKSFKVDKIIKHKFSKTITTSDNSLFCLLSMKICSRIILSIMDNVTSGLLLGTKTTINEI